MSTSLYNKNIIEDAKKKYPNLVSIFEILRSSLLANDLSTIRRFLTEYKGFLPIYWIRLIQYIRSEEMTQLLLDLIGGENPRSDGNTLEGSEEGVRDPLLCMMEAYKMSKLVKNKDMYCALDGINSTFPQKKDANAKILSTADKSDMELIFKKLPNMYQYIGYQVLDIFTIPLREEFARWIANEGSSSNVVRNTSLFKILSLVLSGNTHKMENELAEYDDLISEELSEEEESYRIDLYEFFICMFDAFDMYKIWWSYNPDGNLTYNAHGKILTHRINSGYILENDSYIVEQYAEDEDMIRPFQFRYNVLEHGVSKGETMALLSRAMADNDVEILDRWLTSDKILSIVSYHGGVQDIIPLLEFKEMHPEWFLYYETSTSERPSNLPSDFWSKYLANLLVYGSLKETNDTISMRYSSKPIITRILQVHSADITEEKKSKMISLMEKEKRTNMLSWLQSSKLL